MSEETRSFLVVGHGEDGDGFFVLVTEKVTAEEVVGKIVILDDVPARVRAVAKARNGTALYLADD